MSLSRHSVRRYTLGIVAGLALGSPLAVADAHAARCHNQLCVGTFTLRPHTRRFWLPRTRFAADEAMFVRVEVRGMVLEPTQWGCGDQFGYLGMIVLACPTPDATHIRFMLTNVSSVSRRVTISYEALRSADPGQPAFR